VDSRASFTCKEKLQDLAGGRSSPGRAVWTGIHRMSGRSLRNICGAPSRTGAWPSGFMDLTTRLYGGYQAVLAVHAEGSIEAEKMAMFRAYDPSRSIALAMRLAGLETKAASK
jgi:hypothetical protein